MSGLERLGGEVRAELSRFGPQAGMAELLERWPAAVGAAIARQAWPAGDIASRLGLPGVRFAPGPVPEPASEQSAAAPLVPAPDEVERARILAAPIAGEELRESVQRAVSFHLARERSDRPV